MAIRGARLCWDGLNLLTENQSSLQTNTAGWLPETNCTIARSTAQFPAGLIASLALTATAAAAMRATTLARDVTPGDQITAGIAWRRNTTARQVRTLIRFFDSDGTQVSTVTGADISDSPTDWSTITLVQTTVPASAVSATVVAEVLAPGAGEIHYLSAIWLAQGDVDAFTYGAGDTFVAFELERLDEAGANWERIRYVTNARTHCLDDWESRLNAQTSYRVRWLRSDGAYSDYALPVFITVPSDCRKWDITANELDPYLYVHADEINGSGEVAWTFPDQDESVVVGIWGEDGSMAFGPAENRGDRFEISLIIAGPPPFQTPPLRDGRRAFDGLLELLRSPAQYLCVRDPDGSRWRAQVTAKQTAARDGRLYVADLVVAELVVAPSTPDVVA